MSDADVSDEGLLDPRKPVQIAVVGRKGSGKTELAYLLFDTFPFDKVLIDPNGDIKVGEDVVDVDPEEIPTHWPGSLLERKKTRTLRFVPDFRKGPKRHDGEVIAGAIYDVDQLIGLAYAHQRTMVLIDEAHEAVPAGRTPPHARRALRQGRHRDLSTIWATPRPMTIDPLVISNADYVFVFALPNPNDRKRIAESIGMAPRDFDEAVHNLGEFEYLRYDAARHDLTHRDPLPADLLAHHKK